jgi:hypothetical protein
MRYIYPAKPYQAVFMTNLTAPEVLNDLIEVNNSRITRYEAALAHLEPGDTELRFLFATIIGESHQNKIYLATELQAMGEQIDLSPARRGAIFKQYQQLLPSGNGSARDELLELSDSIEAAVLHAYQTAHSSEDLAAYLKDILTEHETQIDGFRHAILVLRDQTA